MKICHSTLAPMKSSLAILILMAALFAATQAFAEDKRAPLSRDSVISAARELISQQHFCALITVDSMGQPQVRTMRPFEPEEDMTVWIATNSRSRKVREIQQNPRVTLYYADHAKANGYVAIAGRAVLVDDMNEKLKRKRAYWEQSFPDWKYLILIKVVPERMDVLNYKCGALNDSVTWKTPVVEFGTK